MTETGEHGLPDDLLHVVKIRCLLLAGWGRGATEFDSWNSIKVRPPRFEAIIPPINFLAGLEPHANRRLHGQFIQIWNKGMSA